jgi:histone H1/5
MADTAAVVPVVAGDAKQKVASKKKVASKAAKKPADHPKYSEMVQQALTHLKERGGSSRQAVLKYIVKNFKVGTDESVVNTHLKMALKAGVKNATLKQSKGSGAAGSFRIGEVKKAAATKKPAKKAAAGGKKSAAAKKPKSTKTSPAKKAVAAKKPSLQKKSAAAGVKKVKSAAEKKTKKPAAVKKPKKTVEKAKKATSPVKKAVVKKTAVKKSPVKATGKKPTAAKKA